MQTSNLCSFEQAKKLKEIGFDLNTRHVYTPYTNEEQRFWRLEDGYICYREIEKIWNRNSTHQYSAPTVSDALDWLREEKGIACSVNFVFKYNDTTDNVDVQYFGQVLQTFPQFTDQVTEDFDTHPLAESALLDAVLTYLEQNTTAL